MKRFLIFCLPFVSILGDTPKQLSPTQSSPEQMAAKLKALGFEVVAARERGGPDREHGLEVAVVRGVCGKHAVPRAREVWIRDLIQFKEGG